MPLRLKIITGVMIFLVLGLSIFYACLGKFLMSAGFGAMFVYLLALYLVVLLDR